MSVEDGLAIVHGATYEDLFEKQVEVYRVFQAAQVDHLIWS